MELDNTNSEFWFALGDAEYHLENYINAENAYMKVIDLDPDDADIWLEYSHLLLADNRADEALDTIQKGLVFNPDSMELMYRLACYHYILGNINESYRTLTEALERNVDLSTSIFEYTPSMANDTHILELIELYKKQL